MAVQLSTASAGGCGSGFRNLAVGMVVGGATVWWLRDNYDFSVRSVDDGTVDQSTDPSVMTADVKAPVSKPVDGVSEPVDAAADEGFLMTRGGGGTGPINAVEVMRRERRHAIPGHAGVYYNRPRTAPLVSTQSISDTRTVRSAIDPNTDVAFLRLAKQARRGRRMPVVAGAQF